MNLDAAVTNIVNQLLARAEIQDEFTLADGEREWLQILFSSFPNALKRTRADHASYVGRVLPKPNLDDLDLNRSDDQQSDA